MGTTEQSPGPAQGHLTSEQYLTATDPHSRPQVRLLTKASAEQKADNSFKGALGETAERVNEDSAADRGEIHMLW